MFKSKIQVLVACLILMHASTMAQEFSLSNVSVTQNEDLQQLIFSIEVEGMAGDSTPTAIGKLDEAPVLGYVFPTSLKSTDVGFDATTGIVALALTSHPDFDDTPLWDENNDANYGNDGKVWHPHWVVLEENTKVPGGLAVKATTEKSTLPPTNPGMPMYMDSPGFAVTTKGHKVECAIPYYRINHRSDFTYDGVTALMKVNTSKPDLPMLGVYQVYSVASGDLSLPYSVGKHSCDTLIINVSTSSGIGLVSPNQVTIYPNPARNEINIKMDDAITSNLGLQIFDSTGKQVYQQNLNGNLLTIRSSDIGKSGTYLVQVIDADSQEIKGSKNLIITQ